jgi:adenylosuccinate synthase
MKRLTTRQLLNHFANFPDVRVSYPNGPWAIHSINAKPGEWVVALVPAGVVHSRGQLFMIPLEDLDTPMWDVFSA